MKIRIFAALAAILMLVSVLPFAVSAAEVSVSDIVYIKDAPVTVKLSVSKSTTAGSTFDLTFTLTNVSADALSAGINGVSFTLVYDHDLIECDSDSATLTKVNTPSKWEVVTSVTVTDCTVMISNFYDDLAIKKQSDFQFTLTFTVKDGTEGKEVYIYPEDGSVTIGLDSGDLNPTFAEFTVAKKSAVTTTVGGVIYSVDTASKTASVEGAENKSSTAITLPRSITYSGADYAVTAISAAAFSDLDSLAAIYIPCSVTSIGKSIFSENTDAAISGCKGSAAEAYANSATYKFKQDTTGYTDKVTSESTCKVHGKSELTCPHCNSASGEITELPLTEHKFGEWTVVKAATETEEGLKERVCSICGDKETEVIPKVIPEDCKHETTKEVIKKEATCTVAGSKDIVCTVCGEVVKTEEIAALGHKFGEWTVTKAATATTTGTRERVCSVCGEKETEVIPVTACQHLHTKNSHKDPTCTENGYDRTICSDCGTLVSYTSIPKAHTPGSLEVKEATCTEDGYKIQKCTVCGELLVNEILPATGHTFGEWEIVVEATATTDGTRKRTCTTCGQVEVEVIPKLGGDTSDEASAPPLEESDTSSKDTSATSSAASDTSKEAPSGTSNKTIFFIIGGVVIMLTIGYIVIMAINKKKNY